MQNKITILITITLLIFVSLGCGAIKEISKVVDKNTEPKLVRSKDNLVQLTVPASWNSSPELHEEANLGVMQPLNELYTIVIPDKKIDFDESADLQFITDSIKKNSETTIENAEFTKTIPVTVNGMEALQFEAFGVVDKLKVSYIFTIVDGPDHYFQVVSWTLQSLYKENRPILMKVVDSFQLPSNGSGSFAPPPPPPAAKPE